MFISRCFGLLLEVSVRHIYRLAQHLLSIVRIDTLCFQRLGRLCPMVRRQKFRDELLRIHLNTSSGQNYCWEKLVNRKFRISMFNTPCQRCNYGLSTPITHTGHVAAIPSPQTTDLAPWAMVRFWRVAAVGSFRPKAEVRLAASTAEPASYTSPRRRTTASLADVINEDEGALQLGVQHAAVVGPIDCHTGPRTRPPCRTRLPWAPE